MGLGCEWDWFKDLMVIDAMLIGTLVRIWSVDRFFMLSGSSEAVSAMDAVDAEGGVMTVLKA
jgi:hypothetical protein